MSSSSMKRTVHSRTVSRLGILATIFLGLGCGNASTQNGRLAGLEKTIAQAKENGAIRCAPRELALAEAHASFARIELDQGFVSRAEEHLAIAIPNAHAAEANSPPEKCTDRGIVMVKPEDPPPPPPPPGDRDGDGITDDKDKCPDHPETYNGYQDEDGCPDDPDSDGDGIPDSKDQCPNLPEDKDGYQDEDGCPDPDNDGDGIPDDKDKCPNEPEDFDGYEDHDGCPELDNDKDGVPDLDDACPLDPGPADNKGCPKKKALVVVTSSQIKITQQIHFEHNKAKIRKESFPILDEVARALRENPEIKIEVGGHTDDTGSDSRNKQLSQERAESVQKYLVDKGIASDRLTAKGYGKEKPSVPNTSAKNRALNRRVEFVRTESGQPGNK